MAQSAPDPEPDKIPITANVKITNDYRYRGITQTNCQPAIQGGFDYAHEIGLYISNRNSIINWANNTTAWKSMLLSKWIYSGFKKEFLAPGFASDLGILQYYYPQKGGNYNALLLNPNTTEIYAAQNFTFGPATGLGKVNYGLTNIFSIPNSKGSYCLDLTSNYDTVLWGTSVNGHIGYQYIAEWPATVRNLIIVGLETLSYTDWKLGLTKDFGGRPSLSISYVSTNANPYWWNTWSNPNGDVASNSGFASSAGRGGAVVAFIKTF